MPNRIIRDGILSSEAVATLNWAEEVFYRRLMSVVDDYGLYYATPKLLRAACYPLHIDKVSDSDIGKWLTACVNAALVRVYPASDGKRYLQVMKFGQQVRAKTSKFPAPPLHVIDNGEQVTSTCVAPAAHPLADAHLDGDGVVDVSVSEGGGGDDSAQVRASPPIPAGVAIDTWETWKRLRGRKLTSEAIRLQIKHLAEWQAQGHDPNYIVERAISNDWKGLHPPDGPPQRRAADRAPTLAEQRARNMDILTGKVRDERVTEGVTDRMGGPVVLTIPGGVREQDSDDVGAGRPARSATGVG